MLAARIIVAIENPQDVCVISSSEYGQRAVLKFAHYTGCQYVAGRFTPGTFTNQNQETKFMEPRLLVVTDPRTDAQVNFYTQNFNISFTKKPTLITHLKNPFKKPTLQYIFTHNNFASDQNLPFEKLLWK